MSRNMAEDYQETYRARIVWKRRAANPDWKYGDDTNKRYIDDPHAPEHVTYYGPYANQGMAKASFSHHRNIFGRWDRIQVISQTVQKALLTWDDVEEKS